MDPTANLAEQRRIVAAVLSGTSHHDDLTRLAELVEALDEWITRGGFLPTQWKRK